MSDPPEVIKCDSWAVLFLHPLWPDCFFMIHFFLASVSVCAIPAMSRLGNTSGLVYFFTSSVTCCLHTPEK